MTGTYRADVDGLRALAVVSVVLYHFGIPPFSGGFVGVDVFFVISGYLITGIVASAVRSGTFRLATFFDRRSRRLMPALLGTIGVSFLAGFWLLTPEDLARHSAATVAALLAASNLLFWMESGYFDAAAVLKPLLHTWSLSVELQFYLAWPFVVMLLARGRASNLPAGLAVITVFGLLAAVAYALFDRSGAFYLTPFRVWEFAAGGLVATLPPARRAGLRADLSYLLGAALVLVPAIAYSHVTPFPGLTAVPPVLGTALMIWTGPAARPAWLAGLRPLNYVGRISYSLYLVHWPVVVFATYGLGGEMGAGQRAAAMAAVFLISILLHHAVEVPFRKPALVGSPRLNLACIALALLLAVPAADSWVNRGWLWRVPEAVRSINDLDLRAEAEYVWTATRPRAAPPAFITDRRRILVVGDSQAADLVNVLIEGGLDSDIEIVVRIIYFECGIPYLSEAEGPSFWANENPTSMRDPSWAGVCRGQMDMLMNTPALAQADAVVLAYLWRPFALPLAGRAVQALQEHARGPILLAGVKGFRESPARLVSRYGRLLGVERYLARNVAADVPAVNAILRAVGGAHYFDTLSFLCPREDFCDAMTDGGRAVMWDATHLTRDGIHHLWRAGRFDALRALLLTPLRTSERRDAEGG